MTLAARSALLACALLLACAHQPDPRLVIDRVVVRDANLKFQAVRTIDDPATLERVTELWVARRAVDMAPLSVRDYRYALDIAVQREQARWLYRPDGLTTKLELKVEGETFALPDPAAFNALLGIPNTADPQVRTE